MQLKLNIYRGSHGGRRPGSGRKRLHSKGVAHREREKVNSRTPLHINFKFRTYIRNKNALRILKRAILNSRRQGLRILHFSMQSNHIHLIVEAANNEILTSGMRSLTVTFAKGLNKGRIQVERYHLHVLKTIQASKNAIHYVLFNLQKHEKGIYSKIDEYSSVLSMREGLKLIRNFCRSEKVVIKLSKVEPWNLDLGTSYFARKGLSRLLEI
ncbi:hypothetical protein [Peredibacter starrii]|uniref:Transposase IS200-like domain-containing protein n=1 Tax=Peredibacter starrii TaxID=28202 RepID=A0AAX4HTD7_9BACT|nr:hypothetical protein [Peredibacter starrii]WPU66455.1 hypothetical protein SOO65_06820 [Peredibacter starrii]